MSWEGRLMLDVDEWMVGVEVDVNDYCKYKSFIKIGWEGIGHS